MKKTIIIVLVVLFAGWHTTQAQDLSMYHLLNDSAYQTVEEYQTGNKFQKDAILFMDMVAETHPYYVKADRREEWFGKKKGLLERCKDFQTDEEFIDALIDVLGPLHDKHTDIWTLKRLSERKTEALMKMNPQEMKARADRAHIMRPHTSWYDTQYFPEQGICYLQFNKCSNASNYPFPKFLDDMFAEMEKADMKTLVVDVQYNPGGNDGLCFELLQRLYPFREMKMMTAYMRFSDLAAIMDPSISLMKKKWEDEGHKDELYKLPTGQLPADYQQPKIFDGKVVFVQGETTYSSAGTLLVHARDNHIGTIIGTISTYSPSHYGNIALYRLPNTNAYGTISTRYFIRPDVEHENEKVLEPDVIIDLYDKDAAWQYIVDNYGKKE